MRPQPTEPISSVAQPVSMPGRYREPRGPSPTAWRGCKIKALLRAAAIATADRLSGSKQQAGCHVPSQCRGSRRLFCSLIPLLAVVAWPAPALDGSVESAGEQTGQLAAPVTADSEPVSREPGIRRASPTQPTLSSNVQQERPEGLSAQDWRSIRQQIRRGRYQAYAAEGGYASTNQAHGFNIRYHDDGTTEVTPRNGDADAWRLGMRLIGVGYEKLQPIGEPKSLHAAEDKLTYARGNGLTEWWVNDPSGLEQWFELAAPPAGGGEGERLRLTLAVNGDFEAERQDGVVVFRNATTELTYANLLVWDATGERLPARMKVDRQNLTLAIDDTGARYPLTIDPVLTQQAYLKASNTEALDRFGSSIAISDDTVVVGAPGEDSSATGVNGDGTDNSANVAGAAYVFTRSGTGGWSQQAYLKASNTGVGAMFGRSVAVDEDTVVIGAPEERSSATGVGGDQSDDALIDAGAAYVFTRDGSGTWSQQAYIKASNTDARDEFGTSVSVDGDTVVIGALGEDSSATGVDGDQTDNSTSRAGAVYVFTRDGSGDWSQQAYIKASNADGGDTFNSPGDEFGFSVDVSGDTLVVGAPFEDSSATGVNGNEADNSAEDAGAAYVFIRSGTGAWSQQAYLKASNTEGSSDFDDGDNFGLSVAVDGDTVVTGAFGEDSAATGVNGNDADNAAEDAGAAYVFARDGSGTWSQQAYLKASNTDDGDEFGTSVAVDGDAVLVGAPFEQSSATGVNGDESDNSINFAGAGYLFNRNTAGTWSQLAYIKASNPNFDDVFGVASGVAGGTLALGALGEDSSSTGVNGDQTDNSMTRAGAVYVFTDLLFASGFESVEPD